MNELSCKDEVVVRRSRRIGWLGWLAIGWAMACQAKPEAFPDVPLIAECQPRYAAISLDAWGQTVAYVLFDGNVENGYSRMYVWVPDDARYGKPVAFTVVEGNRFAPVRFRAEGDDDEVSEVTWNLRWGYHGTGGTHFNYQTGQTVVREARRSVHFGFNLDFVRERRNTPGQRLDITIPGDLSTATEWRDIRQGQAPWNGIRVQVHINRQVEKEQILLRLTGRLYYQHVNRNCAVQTLPETFFNVNLAVAPYMKDPLFATDLRIQDLLLNGVEVSVDPRWYSIDWDYQTHPWIGSRALRGNHFIPVPRVQ